MTKYSACELQAIATYNVLELMIGMMPADQRAELTRRVHAAARIVRDPAITNEWCDLINCPEHLPREEQAPLLMPTP